MRASTAILMLTIMPLSAAAESMNIQELYELVLLQQAEIAELRTELTEVRAEQQRTNSQVRVNEEQLDLTASFLDEAALDKPSESRLSIGGYGEMHVNDIDADDSGRDVREVDFHRFVTYMNYAFTDRIHLYSELEVEHSLVKDTADGSNGGEVEIEQAFIEYTLDDRHYARTGLFLLPIGITNETHEPNTFYGVERNDVENIIIPSTWWEGGVGMGGRYSSGLSWDFALHSGLAMPTAGSSSYRVRSGRQKVSNASAENLAYTLRLKYSGIPGLELAGSYQRQEDPSQVDDDGLDQGSLVSAHGVWQGGPLTVKALWAQWRFDGAGVVAARVDEQSGWYLEPSIRFSMPSGDWGIYMRFQDLRGARIQDRFEQWEAGVNYWPTEKVVLKLDIRDREHDLAEAAGRDFRALDLGVGYQF